MKKTKKDEKDNIDDIDDINDIDDIFLLLKGRNQFLLQNQQTLKQEYTPKMSSKDSHNRNITLPFKYDMFE